MRPILAMIRKDFLLFFGDKRALIIGFVVPIAIASFFGSLFRDSGNSGPPRTRIAVIDHDSSVISRAIVQSAAEDSALELVRVSEDTARALVRKGKLPVAVIVPAGFGQASGDALFGAGPKPDLQVLYDPSRSMELAMVRGIMAGHVMQAVTKEMFGGPEGRSLIQRTLPGVDTMSGIDATRRGALRRMLEGVQGYYAVDSSPAASAAGAGITMPYEMKAQPITSGTDTKYNSYAHSFAGMSLQFLLFSMTNIGIDMLLERKQGLWKRFRAAPISRFSLLGGKAIAASLIALMSLWVSFAFAMIVFNVQIEGSVAGFIGVSIATALMASTFGLLVAALGNSPATARGITTLAILMMVMLGGGWVPAFIFPEWLQQATKVVPVRWAIDGLDGATWRGLPFTSSLGAIGVLLASATLFGGVALWRFRWEER
jgi:ABC-2 type transport system permease protein